MSVGFILLSEDYVLETELSGENRYFTRILSDETLSVETFGRLKQRIENGAATLPSTVETIVFACTSASIYIGEKMVEKLIQEVRPDVKVSTPITAIMSDLGTLGVQAIGLVSPYGRHVEQNVVEYFEAFSLQVASTHSFEEENELAVSKIPPATIWEAVLMVGASDAVEAVVILCTNLRVLDHLDAFQKRLGKPILSSNGSLHKIIS